MYLLSLGVADSVVRVKDTIETYFVTDLSIFIFGRGGFLILAFLGNTVLQLHHLFVEGFRFLASFL
jgi:hypothetical protein